MSRRTVLMAAVVALAGCQGNGTTMNSAFKLPTPSFNLLAPYGSPRIPPPGTHSYGQPGLLPPTAAGAPQPYYPGASNARGVSLPQSQESGPAGQAPSAAQGKVAAAVWKSSRAGQNEDEADAAQAGATSLASHASGEAPIRIPDVAVQPAEPPALLLGGMPAHDLTGAVSSGPRLGATVAAAPAAALASAALPAPVAAQVIYAAPVAPGTAAVPAAPAASASPEGLLEMSDLPPAGSSAPAANRSLQRVRGFETSPVAEAAGEADAERFIAPQMTISASAARETRDAVAAAALKPDEPSVAPAPDAAAPSGWKSRFSRDES